MPAQLPRELIDLAELQRGIITRSQALAAGLSPGAIRSRVDSQRWQRLHAGVYAIFSGPPDRQAWLWAAVLRAGPGAGLSYQTAAELDGLVDEPSSLIHVTIPAGRRVDPIHGVIVHARLGCSQSLHPARLPPRTRVEETVLDLADCSASLPAAVSWVTKALGRRLTTQDLLRDALTRRATARWRKDLTLLLSDGQAGIHSALEHRYLREVERPHVLPKPARQVRAERDGLVEYRDIFYEDFNLAVELDGNLAHPPETRWRDVARDNAAAASGILTLRYSYRDIVTRPCQVAREIAAVLSLRGWPGTPRPCSPTCPIPHP